MLFFSLKIQHLKCPDNSLYIQYNKLSKNPFTQNCPTDKGQIKKSASSLLRVVFNVRMCFHGEKIKYTLWWVRLDQRCDDGNPTLWVAGLLL